MLMSAERGAVAAIAIARRSLSYLYGHLGADYIVTSGINPPAPVRPISDHVVSLVHDGGPLFIPGDTGFRWRHCRCSPLTGLPTGKEKPLAGWVCLTLASIIASQISSGVRAYTLL
jgi:hypothetical protein